MTLRTDEQTVFRLFMAHRSIMQMMNGICGPRASLTRRVSFSSDLGTERFPVVTFQILLIFRFIHAIYMNWSRFFQKEYYNTNTNKWRFYD